MEVVMQLVLLAVGFVLLVKGADRFVVFFWYTVRS